MRLIIITNMTKMGGFSILYNNKLIKFPKDLSSIKPMFIKETIKLQKLSHT